MSEQEEIDNPFNPAIVDQDVETPSLGRVIIEAVNSALFETHTCLPAKVVRLRSDNYVDVQPLLKRKFRNTGQVVDLPQILQVPVIVPRGTDHWIQIPVAAEDIGLLLFSERSLDAWIHGDGGSLDPKSARKHHLSDAVFLPGLYPLSQPTGADPEKTTIHNGDIEIRGTKSGKFAVQNSSTELIQNLSDLANALISLGNALASSTVLVPPGIGAPTPFVDIPVAAGGVALASAATSLKALIDTLKGG